MNESDVYEGPLDMAKFGRPVSGLLSAGATWLVNPLSYDRTRLTSSHTVNHGEAQPTPISLDTPTGEPRPLGDYVAPTTITSDVDICLLADLGRVVSRGAENVRA